MADIETPLLNADEDPEEPEESGEAGNRLSNSDTVLDLDDDLVLDAVQWTRTLPSFAVFAKSLNAWAQDYWKSKARILCFGEPEKRRWGDHSAFSSAMLRQMSKQYLMMMQGDGAGIKNKLRRLVATSTKKAELVTNLQAAKVLWTTLTSEQHFWTCFNSRFYVFSKKNRHAMCELDFAVIELLKVLALMLFIMQSPAMTDEKKCKTWPPDWKAGFGVNVLHQSQANKGKRMEVWMAQTNLMQKDARTPAIPTAFGIDEAWLTDDVEDSLQICIHAMNYLKVFNANAIGDGREDKTGKYRMLEERTMGFAIQFLAQVIAEIETEIDRATTLQTKIISAISTLMFTLVSFLFNYAGKAAAATPAMNSTAA